MKNRAIEFYRFVFAIVICMHHIRGTVTSSGRFSNFFGAGYLAVDLFFMVSGYLLAAHYDNHREEDAALEPGGQRYAMRRTVGRGCLLSIPMRGYSLARYRYMSGKA